MIDHARSYALLEKERAEACLCALDGDFQIDIVRGAIKQKHISTLQESRILKKLIKDKKHEVK